MLCKLQEAVYAILASVCAIFCSGCNNFETDQRGSWEHYTAGGMLQIGTPAMTDDGRLFFVCGATGHGDIYSVDTATSQLRRVTFSDSFEGSPVVDADGSCLYFSREANGRASVFVLDLQSHAETKVTDGNSFDEPIATLQKSNFLLFSRKHSSLGGHGQNVSYWLSSLGSTTNSAARRIGDFAVADSAGSHLIVLDNNEIWHLTGRDFESRSRISLPFDAVPLAISNDGSSLVVGKQAPEGKWEFDYELYLLKVEPKTISKIGKGHSPVLADSGAIVVFCTGYDNQLQKYVAATQTSFPIVLGASFKSNLVLAERDTSIIFASVTDNRAENYEIYKLPIASLQPIPIFSVNAAAIKQEFEK